MTSTGSAQTAGNSCALSRWRSAVTTTSLPSSKGARSPCHALAQVRLAHYPLAECLFVCPGQLGLNLLSQRLVKFREPYPSSESVIEVAGTSWWLLEMSTGPHLQLVVARTTHHASTSAHESVIPTVRIIEGQRRRVEIRQSNCPFGLFGASTAGCGGGATIESATGETVSGGAVPIGLTRVSKVHEPGERLRAGRAGGRSGARRHGVAPQTRYPLPLHPSVVRRGRQGALSQGNV